MTATRPMFEGLSHFEVVLWYGFSVVSMAVFACGVALLVRKYRRGRAQPIGTELRGRISSAVRTVLTHSSIRRRSGVVGPAHALIFYGFGILFIGTLIIAVQSDLTEPLFGLRFWQGTFYLVYEMCLDIGGLMLVVGLAVMASRRIRRRTARLDYHRPDREEGSYDRTGYVVGDWMFLDTLFFLAITGFALESLRMAAGTDPFSGWAPVGWLLGKVIAFSGAGGTAYAVAHHVLWWIHGLAALTFVASIPFTKAVHMLAAPANLIVRDPSAGVRLPAMADEAAAQQVGYDRVVDLNWPHLVSLDACTKCGKCHEVCPAANSGFPLSPRDLILDLRELAEGAIGIRQSFGVEPVHDTAQSALGEPVRSDTVWSCMQCMACVDICPVGIEHVPIINQFRRQLIERGDMQPTLQSTLENIHTSGNSFGESPRRRPRWTKPLDFDVKDIRKDAAELLWFVGDYASFDPRNQQASRALANVLTSVGVDFGILYDAERTGGCDVRRVGEEGLYVTLAETNVKTISQCEFDRIFSSDPHTFHTLKNEYPAFGGTWTVLHHSQLLLELIERGLLKPKRRLGYHVTYHDPCTLGRYNKVFDAPRRVLDAIGVHLHEMPRNRDNSFCCGAGGGRIWMTDPEGVRRPSEQRIDEALAIGTRLDYFVVACPKDVTMYEDAIKTSGHADRIQLRELSELVLEALQPEPALTTDQVDSTV